MRIWLTTTYMKVAKIHSAAPVGFNGLLVEVESDSSKGLPSLQIVGLGNKAIDEARERVRSAINNSDLTFPAQRITINLAPAELPKDGTHYDLPIALAILVSSGQLRQEDVADAAFAGELALDGTLRPIKGVINLAETIQRSQISRMFVPEENRQQASLVNNVEIIPARTLKDLFLHLKGVQKIQPSIINEITSEHHLDENLMDDIYGQEQAKRALVIAAAGHHNILFTGPPGTGKTLLGKTLANLLPPLLPSEKIAVTKLHSLAGEAIEDIIEERPFRSPHHTASRTSLIGGGSKPRPGDISLAHLGVLFLDEIPEFPRSTLESIRQPLEDRIVTINRTGGTASYPADFMLVATMNPCPCGYYGDMTKECSCSSTQIATYQKRVSGPLLDRIDLIVTVSRMPNSELLEKRNSLNYNQHNEASSSIKNALKKQHNRYNSSYKNNGNATTRDIKNSAHLSPTSRDFLVKAADKLNLSARSYFKVLKVAQTIADLSDSSDITTAHISEALQYRRKS